MVGVAGRLRPAQGVGILGLPLCGRVALLEVRDVVARWPRTGPCRPCAGGVAVDVGRVRSRRTSTAAQLDRICGGIDRAREDPPGEVPAVAKRYLSARRNDDGTTTVTLRILDDTADAVVAAVNAKVDEIVRDGADGPGGLTRSEVIEHRGGRAALRALALTLAIVEGVDTTVMFTVAADAAPADTAPTNTEPISTEPVTRFGPVVERLACDCRVNLTLTDANRKPLSVGRETRVVPRSIRTALAVRDNEMCRFPGCGSTRGLHAHHVIHWLNGGPTELDNLILVCSFHHHVIHDGGSEVERRDVGFRFLTPAGDEATIEHSRGSLHDLYWYTRQQVGEFTRLEPDCYDRIQDLSWITASILHNEEYRRHRDN